MQRTKIGIIGLGGRGRGLMSMIAAMEDIEIVAVCDLWQDRVDLSIAKVKEIAGYEPIGLTNHHDLLNIDEIEGVVVSTSWKDHIKLCIDCMKAGKYSAMEVGGAYALEDCWALVRTYEETRVPVMMLENCNFGREELMMLNMVRQGIFGEVVHCQGGYRHDLRHGLTHNREPEREMRHYRSGEYHNRNCDNYPTHDLGPIAKILDINRGNRMMKLVSTASRASGLSAYLANPPAIENSVPLPDRRWLQGDIITTTITCAHGQTITLVLDTSLPRPYSRNFQVHGTRAMYVEDNRSLFIEGVHNHEEDWRDNWGNVEKFYEQYDHPMWRGYDPSKGGHGGMDYLCMRAFFDAVKRRCPTPIDAYDVASWMSITTLSEDSIAMGGHPVTIPDFTRGEWLRSRDVYEGFYAL
ncbi:MAG: gfo/Idh/MocA family oxidoreductase [Ruminococcaceae bacterium]|nr:gfo/Idh/MocA family oxidoreductase [Oscillospiraceae bacterium]